MDTSELSHQRNSTGGRLLSLGILLTLFAICGRTWRWWNNEGAVLVSGGRVLIIAAILFSISGLLLERRQLKNFVPSLSIFSSGVTFLFLSDWLTRPYNLFQGPVIRGEILLAAAFTYGLILSRRWWILSAVALCFPIVAWMAFRNTSQGQLLFSDDHAMFLFRFLMLKENFPEIPFWYPMWNAGIDARDFFATGCLNFFLLLSPLVYSLDVVKNYNNFVLVILLLLVPLSVVITSRLMSLNFRTASIAVLLGTASSLTWYRWGLKYGTMGFITSTSLAPVVAVLCARLVNRARPFSWINAAFLILTSTLMVMWSLSAIAFLPAAAVILWNYKSIVSDRKRITAVVGTVLFNLPLLWTLWSVSNVASFVTAESDPTVSAHSADTSDMPAETAQPTQTKTQQVFRHGRGGFNARKALVSFQEHAGSMNPLILVFAVPALLALPRQFKIVFLPIAAWLTLLGTFGVSMKPQLELDRMLVILSFLLAVPVSRLLDYILVHGKNNLSGILTRSLLGGFILISPLCTINILENRSIEHYFFADPTVEALSGIIKDNANSGRAVFSGSVLHELSGGHLGPLTYLSGVPLVASSYAHNIWKYEQIIPASFMKQDEAGIERFFDLMNTTVTTAHEPYWINYFSAHPEKYTLTGRTGRFYIYRRRFKPSYFEIGDGLLLEQSSNSITIRLNQKDAVLRFKFFPFLQSSACNLSEFKAAPDLSLLKLTDCPVGEPVTIKSIAPVSRIMGSR